MGIACEAEGSVETGEKLGGEKSRLHIKSRLVKRGSRGLGKDPRVERSGTSADARIDTPKNLIDRKFGLLFLGGFGGLQSTSIP